LPSTTRPAFIATARRANIRPISLKALILKRPICQILAADLFWIIKNGIKMSAMASYGKVHNDDEIWNVVAFVQRIPTIRPEEYEQLEKETQ
jgi:cbb3-type cytochrome c oxidase subunit III